MADYPSLPQVYGTAVTAITDSVRLTRADSGEAWVRHVGARRYEIRAVHVVNATDRDSVIAHYDAHTLLDFTFTALEDSATYTVRYVAPPRWAVMQAFDSGGGHLYQVEALMEGTQD